MWVWFEHLIDIEEFLQHCHKLLPRLTGKTLVRTCVTNRTWEGHGRILHGIRTGAGQEPGQGPGEYHWMAPHARGRAPGWDTLMQIYNCVFNSGQLKSRGSRGHVMCGSKAMWKGRLQFGEGEESKAKGTSTFFWHLFCILKIFDPM